MDKKGKLVDENKNVEKKLTQTAKRIVKRRKKNGLLEKELSEFEEIRSLLKATDNAGVSSCTQPLQPPVLEVNEIPWTAPGIDLLQPTRAFKLFTEDSLELSKFVKPGQTFFGRSLTTLSDRLFRKLLTSLIYDERCTKRDISQELGLYVLHLLSVTADVELQTSCRHFLDRFPCQLTASDVIPILANFGADLQELCGPDLQVLIPTYLVSFGQRRDDFPARNFRLICNVLTSFAEKNLILCDESVKPLVVALTKLSLDLHIRRSCLLPPLCCLLTQIARASEAEVGTTTVASWLFLPEEHLLNQLDICRSSVRPVSPTLHHTLLRLTVNGALKSRIKLSTPFEINDLKAVLRYCNKKKTSFSLLQLFTVVELLITSLPLVTAQVNDNVPISGDLPNLDGLLLNMKESSDLVRLRAATAKLNSLVSMKSGPRLTRLQQL